MKKLIFLLLFTACITNANAQQDAQFSQYIFNGLYINPAYAGYKQDMYVHSFYRSQWTGLDGAPQTFSLAGDVAVHDSKVGLGVLITRDEIGAQDNTAFYGNYSYHIQMGDKETSKLALGLGLGFIQAGLNGSKLHATEAGDLNVPTTYQGALLPDARLGAMFTSERFFAGISVDNLLSNYVHTATGDKSLIIVVPKPHYYLTFGGLLNANGDTKYKPSIMFKDSPGSPTSVDFNNFVLFDDKIWIGGTYRTALNLYPKNNLQSGLQKSSALVAMAEFFVNENFRIGYAFDYSMSTIGSVGYGSHELSIGITFKSYHNYNYNRCYF
jgi:type IX secretion system PorP/SprF family membrane protein